MRALTATDVVSAWERTRGQPPLRQALEYLACAEPERPRDEWIALPLGHLCHALFRLRAIMFGPTLPGIVNCPRCDERLEFTFSCRDVPAPPPAATSEPIRVEHAGRTIVLRLPTAADLLASRSAADLFACCVCEPLELREPVEPSTALIEAASARVAEADPLIETLLDLTCPACGHRWQALLDIVSYLTHELSHQARRLLGEVHRLASAYGWREHDILALSAVRRQAYLEMVGA